jgi:hypothetical protein
MLHGWPMTFPTSEMGMSTGCECEKIPVLYDVGALSLFGLSLLAARNE